MIGCLTTMAVGYVISLLESSRTAEQLEGLTWVSRRTTAPEPAERAV